MEGLGVTTESIGYLLLSAVSATVAGLRASQWHDRPESRTVTVVSALFSAGYLLANPRLRGFLASDAAAEHHLANWANVVGDSLATAASVCLIANIARAWGFQRSRIWVMGLSVAGWFAMVLQWQTSPTDRGCIGAWRTRWHG